MIIYNVTINVENDIEQEWLVWMRDIHIGHVMETGYFYEFRFLRLLTEVPDATGVTYAVQYLAHNKDDLENYLTLEAPRLRQEGERKFPGKFVAFRTLLEEVA